MLGEEVPHSWSESKTQHIKVKRELLWGPRAWGLEPSPTQPPPPPPPLHCHQSPQPASLPPGLLGAGEMPGRAWQVEWAMEVCRLELKFREVKYLALWSHS